MGPTNDGLPGVKGVPQVCDRSIDGNWVTLVELDGTTGSVEFIDEATKLLRTRPSDSIGLLLRSRFRTHRLLKKTRKDRWSEGQFWISRKDRNEGVLAKRAQQSCFECGNYDRRPKERSSLGK